MKFLMSSKISEHQYETPEGYLVCVDSIIARCGKQKYRKSELFTDSDDDSEIEVDRPYNEVFNPTTIASFENQPFVNEHPNEDVNISNYKDLSVGFVRDVREDKEDGKPVLKANIIVTDPDTIQDIKSKRKTDLSCGYDCSILKDNNGGYYQSGIRGNHVALCEQGRAGNARIIDTAIEDGGFQEIGNFWRKLESKNPGISKLVQEFYKTPIYQHWDLKNSMDLIYSETMFNEFMKFYKQRTGKEMITDTKTKDSKYEEYRKQLINAETRKELKSLKEKIEEDESLSDDERRRLFRTFDNMIVTVDSVKDSTDLVLDDFKSELKSRIYKELRNINSNYTKEEVYKAVVNLYNKNPYLTLDDCLEQVINNIKNGNYLLDSVKDSLSFYERNFDSINEDMEDSLEDSGYYKIPKGTTLNFYNACLFGQNLPLVNGAKPYTFDRDRIFYKAKEINEEADEFLSKKFNSHPRTFWTLASSLDQFKIKDSIKDGKYDEYFGQEEYEKYGKLVKSKLKGKTISKRRDLSQQENGLEYEAEKLGISPFELLRCLEGMCYNNEAKENYNSSYTIKDSLIKDSISLKELENELDKLPCIAFCYIQGDKIIIDSSWKTTSRQTEKDRIDLMKFLNEKIGKENYDLTYEKLQWRDNSTQCSIRFTLRLKNTNDSIKDVNPKKGESKEDFISRFMEETENEYPDKKQRLAVAFSYWKKHSVKDDYSSFLGNYGFDYLKGSGDYEYWYLKYDDEDFNKLVKRIRQEYPMLIISSSPERKTIYIQKSKYQKDSIHDSKVECLVINLGTAQRICAKYRCQLIMIDYDYTERAYKVQLNSSSNSIISSLKDLDESGLLIEYPKGYEKYFDSINEDSVKDYKEKVVNGYVIGKNYYGRYTVYNNKGHFEEDKNNCYKTEEEAIRRAKSLPKGIAIDDKNSIKDEPDMETNSGKQQYYLQQIMAALSIIDKRKWNLSGTKVNVDNNKITIVATSNGIDIRNDKGNSKKVTTQKEVEEYLKQYVKDSKGGR